MWIVCSYEEVVTSVFNVCIDYGWPVAPLSEVLALFSDVERENTRTAAAEVLSALPEDREGYYQSLINTADGGLEQPANQSMIGREFLEALIAEQ